MWTVYIIQRKDSSLYIGMTIDIERRLQEHRRNMNFCEIESIYKEQFPDKFKAAAREKQLKGWTRKKKLALMAGDLELLKKL